MEREQAIREQQQKELNRRESQVNLKTNAHLNREKSLQDCLTYYLSDDAVGKNYDAISGPEKNELKKSANKQEFENLLVLSALVSPSVINRKTADIPEGVPEEVYIQDNIASITQGLLYGTNTGKNSKELFTRAKETAAAALADYRDGKPKAMAQLLGHGLKQISMYGRRTAQNVLNEMAVDKTALWLQNIIEGSPKLKKHAGLSAEDMRLVQDIRERVNTHEIGLKAIGKIEKAWAGMGTMSEAEKKDLMADMVLDAMLRNADHAERRKAKEEHDDLTSQIREARKTAQHAEKMPLSGNLQIDSMILQQQREAREKLDNLINTQADLLNHRPTNDISALLSFQEENRAELKKFIMEQPEFQKLPDPFAARNSLSAQSGLMVHTSEIEKATTAMSKAFREKVNTMTAAMKDTIQFRKDKAELQKEDIARIDNMMKDTEPPQKPLTLNEEVLEDVHSKAQLSMDALVQDASMEDEKATTHNFTSNLQCILFGAVADKMVARHEEKFGKESVPAIISYLKNETPYELQDTMLPLPVFQQAAHMRGTDLVKLLRDPERMNKLLDTMMPDMIKALNQKIMEPITETFDEKVEVAQPVSKEAPETWVNPLTKEEPVSQPTEDPEKSKADRQRAFSIAYNEIKAASEGREVHRYMDDETWSLEHKDLIESVREEAQKKYREDVRKLNAAAERKRIDAEAAARIADLDRGRAIVQQYITKKESLTPEQKEFAKKNPRVMRDATEAVKANYSYRKAEKNEPENEKLLQLLDNTIQSFGKNAIDQKDPIETAKRNVEQAPREAHDMSIRAAKTMMQKGRLTPEQEKWTAENPELAQDAMLAVKAVYAESYDRKPHDDLYYQQMHNADKHLINLAKQLETKAAQNTRKHPTARGPMV